MTEGGKAHHGKGRFVNPWPSFCEHGLGDLFKMGREFMGNQAKIPDSSDLKAFQTNLDLKAIRDELLTDPKEVRLTWLGHAAFLLQMSGGVAILFDPIFSNRCSPVQFAGPARYTPPPCKLEDIADLVDAVVISHNQ